MMRSKTSWVCRCIRFLAILVEAFEHELKQARQRRYEREHPPCPRPRLLADGDDPEMARVHEVLLRRHLHDALHRFSPSEQTPEA